MAAPFVLVRTRMRVLVLVYGLLIGGAGAGILLAPPGSLAHPGVGFLMLLGSTAALGSLLVFGHYSTLELDGSTVTFRGPGRRPASFPVSALEAVTAGRACYSFQFAEARRGSVSLYTYLTADRFLPVLNRIAASRTSGAPFVFEHGKTRMEL